ncbi:MAG TPA: alpha/beta fold hydrolase [Phnomibacter sp.]|nr:alpha/beta fold hydrolase [Phnomibacter sp.]
MARRRKILKRLIWTIVVAFILMNVVAIFHSYKFTHFADTKAEKTQKPEKLNFGGKLKALFFGVNNPRPTNKAKPFNFETVELQSNKKIECWYTSKATDTVKGTIILCHGYGGEKSSMLDKAEIFDSLHYNTLLIDFMGSGGSEGNTTTIGFKEAVQVKSAYDFLTNKGVKDICLFGTSMGAVAIMKAVNDYDLKPKGIIIECPFGTMYETVSARFKNMNVPAFPMAGLLVFWGGVQNGFWAFGHNPTEYAKTITCPTLLLYGKKDKNVSKKEIDNIYTNLAGQKILKTYPLAGHENYLIKYKTEWTQDVTNFLTTK